MSEEAPPNGAERLVDVYKRLAASAEDLGSAANEFAKPVAKIDQLLQQLQLGVTAWERVNGGEDRWGSWWNLEVGYARIGDGWGLAIRRATNNLTSNEEDDVDVWLFNNAPRSYRIDAFDKIPDLLEKLTKSADKTAKKLKEKTTEAHAVADVLSIAADATKIARKARKS